MPESKTVHNTTVNFLVFYKRRIYDLFQVISVSTVYLVTKLKHLAVTTAL